jgi:hypothetical protein
MSLSHSGWLYVRLLVMQRSILLFLGNFFHLKYVVIFGLPSIFARLDNMQPKDGPMCIARVALISKVWRGFDRGLYEFFKVYMFVPICAPTFSLTRKIFGVLVSYTFVLLWHGFLHHNVVSSLRRFCTKFNILHNSKYFRFGLS